ncbi:MAG: acetyl-CoA carboxylase biotin carboxyl carrier protein [Flavobacteriia bacterium]|nr:acetyl-CoA carboxylase biotin carboxyl carrier protein [Flavobacteriia bacterium]
MNLNEIQELIKFVSKTGVSEVEIERKDFKIVIKTESKQKEQVIVQASVPPVYQSAPATTPINAPTPTQNTLDNKPENPIEEKTNLITIKSPMIGTFYRSSSPDKDPYVQVGDSIQKGATVCVIEAMKLFNEIESEISGKIVKVLVDDASPVEYDQALFLVDPS